jgi:hypothetical protein
MRRRTESILRPTSSPYSPWCVVVRLLLSRHPRPDVRCPLPSLLIDRWHLRHRGMCLSSEFVYLWSSRSLYWIHKHGVCWGLIPVYYLKISRVIFRVHIIFQSEVSSLPAFKLLNENLSNQINAVNWAVGVKYCHALNVRCRIWKL